MLKCRGCGNTDSTTFEFSEDGRFFRCPYCSTKNSAQAETGQRAVPPADELNEILRSVRTNIRLGRYEAVKRLLLDACDRYPYSPEIWYYLALAETNGFRELSAEGAEHLGYAAAEAEEDGSEMIRSLIEKAEAKLRCLESVRDLKEEEAQILARRDQLAEDIAGRTAEMDTALTEAGEKRRSLEELQAGIRNCAARLSLNRTWRFILAAAAAGLFVFAPWTRNLWNGLFPPEYRIGILPEVTKQIGDAIGSSVPRGLETVAGLAVLLFCAVLLRFAFKSGRAARLKSMIRDRRSDARSRQSQVKEAEEDVAAIRKELAELEEELGETQRQLDEKSGAIRAYLEQNGFPAE